MYEVAIMGNLGIDRLLNDFRGKAVTGHAIIVFAIATSGIVIFTVLRIRALNVVKVNSL